MSRASPFSSGPSLTKARKLAVRVLDAPTGGRGEQAARLLLYAPVDAFEAATRRRGQLLPPRRLRFIGRGDFEAVGNEFLGHFIELGGLRPDARVLDVGCGVGRMAIPLSRYLNERGSYEGFDIVRPGIEWCRKNISRSYPNFNFRHADVRNEKYNPRGQLTADSHRFPYPDDEFDFAFLTSVFTHMLPAEVERYTAETARVLKAGATALITWFLLNEGTERRAEPGAGLGEFEHKHDHYRTVSDTTPEQAIAYEEPYMRDLMGRNGLEIVEPIHFGSWGEGETGRSYQDIVVLRRTRAPR